MKSETKQKALTISKAVLTAIGLAGALVLVMALPGLPAAVAYWYWPAKRYRPRQIQKSLNYLERRKLIGITRQGKKTVIVLTENGKRKLLKYKFEDMTLPKRKHWDGKLRLVLYDIPEKFKTRRDAFSFKLKSIGMVQIQKSVCLWPYDCEEEVEFLKEVYEIRPFVKYALVEKIELQRKVLDRFNLT